jgi:hypothetical protein
MTFSRAAHALRHAVLDLTRRASGPRGFGAAVLLVGVTVSASACETIDPGPSFVVADERFDPDFFFCKVEPEVLFAKKCGSGDPGQGDRAGGCHFNPSAVSGMALVEHPPVDCGGGERPVNRAQIGAGSPAQANLEAASIVMSRDINAAPIFVRPTGANHPRAIFPKNDPAADVLRAWAQK